jgi:hypothetical protein
MRRFAPAALLALALPALAESLTLASQHRAVTVYPSGAEVTRQIAFTAARTARDAARAARQQAEQTRDAIWPRRWLPMPRWLSSAM